mmetsp:Transcript_11201/g.23594  ORF Transcript_11201/g.23594 Transcript_11201/m.23594 type:complete len:349 (+) Transcript_11201:294-1340(+)
MGSCLSTPEVTSTTTAKPQKPSASTSPAVAAKSPVARSQVKGGKDSEASKRIEDGKSNTMGAAGSSPARPAGNSTAKNENGSPITPTKSITSSGYSSPDNTDNNSTSSGKSNKDFDENASTHSQTSRRKSKLICHSDSRVGLSEIICDIGKNPNLVRIEVPLGKPIEEVYEGVHDGPVLGSGISGIVRLVKHRTTQVNYAVKCLDLAMIDSEEGLKQLKEEIYIMCQLVSEKPCVPIKCNWSFITSVTSYHFTAIFLNHIYGQTGSSQHCPSRRSLRISLRNLSCSRGMQGWRTVRSPRRTARLPLHRGPMCQTRQANAQLRSIHSSQGNHSPRFEIGEFPLLGCRSG